MPLHSIILSTVRRGLTVNNYIYCKYIYSGVLCIGDLSRSYPLKHFEQSRHILYSSYKNTPLLKTKKSPSPRFLTIIREIGTSIHLQVLSSCVHVRITINVHLQRRKLILTTVKIIFLLPRKQFCVIILIVKILTLNRSKQVLQGQT
jgi:hypothetical protein